MRAQLTYVLPDYKTFVWGPKNNLHRLKTYANLNNTMEKYSLYTLFIISKLEALQI